MIEQIPLLGGEIDARARSAMADYTLYFANISSILDECNMISDSISRLSIQGNCLDLLTNLEEMLEGLELEN